MGNNPSRNHAGENGNRRGASQECRPKTIVCQNPMQTFCDCLEACTNPVYTQIILLFQSKETGNFRQGLEYVILGQRENVTRHDGTSLQVEVAMDRVNRRLFGLYQVSIPDFLKWIPAMMLATYQTLCPKVYGFLFKKRQAEIILFLRLPGQDEKSLRKYLEWCKGDMDVLKDITAQLFTEINRWHNQGVANLGITLDTVYVCQDNFTSVVWGDLSCPKFRGCEGFDNGKFRDVDNARNLIMSYLERIHLRSPLYRALQTPNNSATRIAWNILGLKITQEISYNQVTDAPCFEPMRQYPEGLLSVAHPPSMAGNELGGAEGQEDFV